MSVGRGALTALRRFSGLHTYGQSSARAINPAPIAALLPNLDRIKQCQGNIGFAELIFSARTATDREKKHGPFGSNSRGNIMT